MLATHGRNLLSYNSRDLFDVAYFLLLEQSSLSSEAYRAIEQIDSRLRDLQYEKDSGMPAISQWMRPVDEMYGETE